MRRPAPRRRRGAGAPCLAARLREPPDGVSLRVLRSPVGLLAGLGTLRFPRRLREPAASTGQYQGRALFPSAASGAGTLRLRLRVGLPSLAAEPLRVSLLVAGPATAVPALCRRAAYGVSPWRRGALPPRSDFRLARPRAPRALFLFRYNIFSRGIIINPDVSFKAGCFNVDARFIARTLLSRQGWKRLCGGGIASSIKLSHQVLFFLPITALTILAIATAMPSDGRLCSRQK